ncbi:hypothetical protein N7448_002641 [Penicillium atrosanguineum]|uniref:uncharacterized protein n=1 Tax=Penicillium atrosanguineum TaxID=1132637 RepID=UPI00238BD0DB|nr:uncharacterized protein N7443_006046 [Penicillium atrosanguineum]KAJ5128932.1 hypothetical protein N7526_007098 [Penicillium atrosanguineum]KAJ5145249.1 hypothetical protein N7448_002641 [Penicillium atrosanguineum]KAJ5301044.1 hypothetical protein N7443_006046 [Penicillium atrosanguineum]
MQVEASTRAFVMALKVSGKNYSEIADLTGLPKRSVRGICDFAVNKGFDADKRPLEIKDAYFASQVRGERKRSPEKKTAVRKVAAKNKNVVAEEEYEEEEEQKEELADDM